MSRMNLNKMVERGLVKSDYYISGITGRMCLDVLELERETR